MNWVEIRSSFYYRVALMRVGLLVLALLFYLAPRRFLDPQILYFDDFLSIGQRGG